jgi:hypothetical protein
MGIDCFSQSAVKEMCIPPLIETLESWCFADAKVEQVEFGSPSKLVKIERWCFMGCPLRSICLPNSVTDVDEHAFGGFVSITRAGPGHR